MMECMLCGHGVDVQRKLIPTSANDTIRSTVQKTRKFNLNSIDLSHMAEGAASAVQVDLPEDGVGDAEWDE
jgi:hypothetical protein